jgi:hypothetical protein
MIDSGMSNSVERMVAVEKQTSVATSIQPNTDDKWTEVDSSASK